jgi:hypothetical protein
MGLRERNFLKLLQNQENSPYLCSPLQPEAFETCELKVTKNKNFAFNLKIPKF